MKFPFNTFPCEISVKEEKKRDKVMLFLISTGLYCRPPNYESPVNPRTNSEMEHSAKSTKQRVTHLLLSNKKHKNSDKL